MMVHNKRLRRLTVVAFVVAAALVVGFGPPDGPLAFEDDRPLELQWEEALEGTVMVVRNVGNTKLEELQAMLTGFNFKVGKEPKPDDTVLSLPGPEDVAAFTLNTGEAMTITVQATGFTPDEGEYKGLLVVSGPSAGLIRREITIFGPEPDTKPATVESAVGDIVLTGTLVRTGTLDEPSFTVRFDNPYLPLKPAGDGETLSDFEKEKPIGIVYSEGHFGQVYVDGEPDDKSEEGVILLPIRVEGLDAVGTYAGKLDVTGTGKDEEAINVQVKVAAVKSAADDIVLPAWRNGPFLRTVRLDKHYGYLPLKPVGAETLTFPRKDPLGIIYSKGHFGYVYVDGELDTSHQDRDVVLLPIRVEGLDEVGTYSGKLNLAGTGKGEGAIDVKVEVTDELQWPIIAGAFGLVLGIGASLWRRRCNPKLRLRREAEKLKGEEGQYKGKYGKAHEVFKDKYSDLTTYPFGKYRPKYDEINKYSEEFKKALSAYASSHIFFNMESDDYKNLTKALKDAEEDANCIGDADKKESPFGESLNDLQTKLNGLATFLNNVFPGQTKPPAFVKSVAARVKPQGEQELLAVGMAKEIATEAQGYVDLIKDWQDMATQVKQYLLWAGEIEKHPKITDPDKELLQRAKAKVRDTRNEMFDCTDASSLSTLSTSEGLRIAYDQLAYLGSRYGLWKLSREDLLKRRVKGVRHSLRMWLDRVTPGDWQWLRLHIAPEIEQAILFVGDAIVIGLAVAAAIVSVLATKYFDKTFGTWEQYLTLVLIDAFAATAVTSLPDIIAELRKPLVS